ncbi:innexin unc-9 [Clonorchis sinensis]|uniref:Innexin n=1 Tax=Clonorchis sinensis TaxID=79923 RepID=G7YTE6_CLOSI|nr:innexin unc-9 [Clonorchis sinensis]
MNADYVWKLSKFGRLTSTRLRFDDDFADRLNYQLTGLLLFVFVGIIGIRQYVGKPIHCWTPQEFTRSWEEYAENYCWVASTYFVRLHSYPGPPPPQMVYPQGTMTSGRFISYYQWAPILLAIQSFLFYLPCLIWRLFSSRSGFHVSINLTEHKESIRSFGVGSLMGSHCDAECPSYLCLEHGLTKPRSKCVCARHQGNFLVRLYMFVKLLYVCNVVGQIYLLEYYTGVQYNFYGIRVLYDLATGRQWEESGHFPRVTFCDFEARKLAQSHYYTLQCVLPINMFLEKIYIFLWLWFFAVGVVTLLSMIVWITRIGTSRCRFSWIRHQLLTIRQFNKSNQSCMQFVESHLGPDGVFVLRLISQNYGDLVAGDTVGELWTAYWQRRQSGVLSASIDGRSTEKQLENVNTQIGKQPVTHVVRNTEKSQVKRIPRSARNTPMGGQEQTHTPSGGDPLQRGGSQKERRRKNLMQTGYSATMMATEMIHPSDRFAVPLLSSSRKPPSVDSQDSSRYSRESRDRERSISPPPIPQRSSDGAEYSLSEQRSIADLELGANSQVSLDELRVSPPRGEDVNEHEVGHVVTQDDFDHADVIDRRYQDVYDGAANGFDQQDYNQYREDYNEGFNHDDHIV